MVTTIYADAFGFIYDDFDDMCRAYAWVPNAINLLKSKRQACETVQRQSCRRTSGTYEPFLQTLEWVHV